MGYYTNFEVKVLDNKTSDEVSIDTLDEDCSNVLKSYDYAHMKGYNHHLDMLLASSKIPDKTIFLNGQGEDPQDKWEKVYMAGRMIREVRYKMVPVVVFDINN